MIRNQRTTAVGCLLIALIPASLVANPTGQDPKTPLAAHGTIEGAKAMAAGLYELHDEQEAFVIKASETEDLSRLSDRQIANAAGTLWQARRDVDHLKLMGEPAANDLSRKFFLLAVEIDKIGNAYRGTPKGTKLYQRIQTTLRRQKPSLLKFLGQAERALQQGKLEAFEKQMEIRGKNLYSQLVFFTPTARKPFNTEFNALLGKGDDKLEAQRKKTYREQANKVIAEQSAAATAFAPEATRIAREIASVGTADLGDGKSGGPVEAVTHVVGLWGKASAGLIRSAAIQWAMSSRALADVRPDPAQLKEAGIGAIASIIDSAAASTPADQVQTVYCGLLQEVTVAARRLGTRGDELTDACQPSLDKLAAKDPNLPARIERYGRATSEPLRWRSLFAYQQARNLSAQFSEPATVMNEVTEIGETIRPSFARRGKPKTAIAPRTFIAPASWIVYEAADRMTGKPIALQPMVRLTRTSRTAVVPFDSGVYGNVPIDLPVEAEVDDLRTALVADDSHPPLTLEAAGAVSAATLSDYDSVAGLVEKVHLESPVTRFAGLPDVAHTLVPLGSLPELDRQTDTLTQTCWRIDLKPLWARQKYFTVRATKK